MYSQFHQEFAKANQPVTGPHGRATRRPEREKPPPRRLRGGAAHVLAATAQRLDGERARRALA